MPPPDDVTIDPAGELVPNARTAPADGGDDPLREPTRPKRERTAPDRFGTYGIAALAAHYAESSGLGFTSRRLPEHAFAVCSDHTLDRLIARSRDHAPTAMLAATCTAAGANWCDQPDRYADRTPSATVMERDTDCEKELLAAAFEDELRSAYGTLSAASAAALTVALDHEDIAAEYGSTSPQAKMVREVYAAAMYSSAVSEGVSLPPLDQLLRDVTGSIRKPALDGMYTLDRIFDDDMSGGLYAGFAAALEADTQDLWALAKGKSSPDIFTERQMRGAEWDGPKQSEIAKLERLEAKTDVAADDPMIKGIPVCDTMWTGRLKRDDKGEMDKRNARCVLRGDLHKRQYHVTANESHAPVARNTSLSACEAVGRLRRRHYTSGDVPGAYLQGEQRASEQAKMHGSLEPQNGL